MTPCWPVNVRKRRNRQLGYRRQAAVSGSLRLHVAKDDPQFKKLMDDTIAQVQTSVKRKNGLINGSKIPFRRKTEHEFRTVRRNESTVQRTE